jgi:hypothetical protein
VNPQLAFSFFTLIAGSNVLGEGMYLRGFTALGFSSMPVAAPP